MENNYSTSERSVNGRELFNASNIQQCENSAAKDELEMMIGNSEPIQHVKSMITRVGPTGARVLVTGSSGTGKELVARCLHKTSGRRGLFVEVNCAAIPNELIESELFGHEKGAFTSAIKIHRGKFEQAEGGTLFLDEIGDMSLAAQSKMLRALQEKKISRVGGDRSIPIDVRVVAATNKDLRHEIEVGNFREDLYHRLSVIVIRVPTLAERAGDIPKLVGHFIATLCYQTGMPAKKVDKGAMKLLQGMKWSGNIRELQNVVERLIIFSDEMITAGDVKQYALPDC